jgi:hypothetical protein
MYVDNNMKPSKKYFQVLRGRGYSTNAIEEMWKWCDYSEKKGIASF